MFQVTIEPKEEGKGRSFSAQCLAYVSADTMWEGGLTGNDAQRPVWAMFAGSENELKPFGLNLLLGNKAVMAKDRYSRREDRMGFLKSTRYSQAWQREDEGSLLTLYLPQLFQLDPGMVDQIRISFILLPSISWVASQKINQVPILSHMQKLGIDYENLEDLIPTAYLFASYLDRRTRCPLVMDGRFYTQLLFACLDEGIASFSGEGIDPYSRNTFGYSPKMRFVTNGIKDVGIGTAIAFHSDHVRFEEILAEQTVEFFKVTK